MPNIRITNTTPNIRDSNIKPNLKISNIVPNIREFNLTPNIRTTTSASQVSTISTPKTFGGAGYPLGILMAITTNKAQTTSTPTNIVSSSDFKPNIRIYNQ